MFIQTEETPNPLTLKFLPGREVSPEGPREFRSAEEALASPLARNLFEIEGVARVFFGSDFLTITRHPEEAYEFRRLKAPILAAVMDHYTSGAPLYEAARPEGESDHDEGAYTGEAAEIVAEIKDLLDTRIRPAVAQDGGDILFNRFEAETGTVYLHMRGACSGCPSSAATLRSGVENMLRHYVPEVRRVEQAL